MGTPGMRGRDEEMKRDEMRRREEEKKR